MKRKDFNFIQDVRWKCKPTVQPRSQGISLAWGDRPGIRRSRDPKIPRFRGYFKLTEIIIKLNSFQSAGFTWIKYGHVSILKCKATSEGA